MARSSGVTGQGSGGENFAKARFQHAPTGYNYFVRNAPGAYVLQWSKAPGAAFQRRMPFYVGSGAVARSYLMEEGSFLFQSPVAYYSVDEKWDLAPGYQRYKQPFVTRPVAPGCLQCHASGLQHRPSTQSGYTSPPFLEGGVGCERCHGPGAGHIAAARKGSTKLEIVHPGKLSPPTRDSVCTQCHLTGEARFVRAGRNFDSFRAGDVLDDHMAVFVRSGASAGMRVTSHVENLAQSQCKQASGDKLWCGTCHDPHTVPAPEARVGWYRSKCLTCHATQACKAPSALRRQRNDDCAACHMPRNPVTDAQHVVYTNHAIPRRPAAYSRLASATPGELQLFSGAKAADRDLGLAYAIVGQRDGMAAFRAKAFEILKRANSAAAADPEALAYLAELYAEKGERERAVELYEEALRLDPGQLTAPVNLGAIRMEQGRYADAIRLWNNALSKNPALLLVRTNLAAALLKIGNRQEAEAVLRRATDFNPEFVAPRWLTDQLSAK